MHPYIHVFRAEFGILCRNRSRYDGSTIKKRDWRRQSRSRSADDCVAPVPRLTCDVESQESAYAPGATLDSSISLVWGRIKGGIIVNGELVVGVNSAVGGGVGVFVGPPAPNPGGGWAGRRPWRGDCLRLGHVGAVACGAIWAAAVAV